MNKRPNIILIMTDQQRFDTISALGAGWMMTPNLDRMAREGTVFQNCYTPSPLCGPARASLFKGVFPHRHGITSNFYDWQPDWVKALAANGYHCASIGKMHTNPYDVAGGFHQRIIVENKDRGMFLKEPARAYYDHWDIALRTQKRRKPSRESRFREDPQYFREALGAFAWEHEEALHPDVYVGETARWWLEERQAEEPLFLSIGFPGPHPPYDPTQRFIDMYADVDVPMPHVTSAELRSQPAAQAAVRQNMIDKNLDCVAWLEAPDESAMRRMRRYYAANITMIDEQVGRIFETLREKDYLENALVIFTSDHGENLGDHGHIQKWNMYDTATKVPLIIWSSNDKHVSGEKDALVQLFDIAPTILESAGIEPPKNWEAVSLMPILSGEETQIRSSVYSELFRDHIQSEAECIVMRRDRRWKIVWYLENEEGELYDLETDPGEVQNLWAAKEHLSMRDKMVSEIKHWMIKGMLSGRGETSGTPPAGFKIS